jgi:hypothetical protein
MTAISPRRDDIGEAIGADGHLSRQGKNYEHNYKTKRPCKAYMSLRHKVLPSDAQIPPVVNRVVRAGVDREGWKYGCRDWACMQSYWQIQSFKR